jgi:hypothetical protein
MLYYSESWAEDAPDESEIEAHLKAYSRRIKARRMQAIDKALARYKGQMQPPTPTVQSEGLSCKVAGG